MKKLELLKFLLLMYAAFRWSKIRLFWLKLAKCQQIVLVGFIVLYSNLCSANFSYTVSGISGAALTNVDKRLNELKRIKNLAELSDTDLSYQITNALQPFGYFKAQIKLKRISSDELSISIQPGSLMRITALHTQLLGEGANNPILRSILQKIPLKIDTPLSIQQYNQSKQDIALAAEHLGYLRGSFSKAELLIDESKNSAEITLIFDTGPQYYFGQIQFDPTYINPELLHRFVPFKPGQPYSSEQLIDLNSFLTGSGYFNSVVVKPEIGDDPTVPVQIHLQPVPKYSYSLGVGYGTDTGIRGRAGLQTVPVNRWGHKFNALAQASQTQSAVQAQYLIPGANPVEDQYSITGNYSSLNYDSGYSNSVLASIAQQHHIQGFQRTLSLNALYEEYHYNYMDSLLPNNDQFILYPKATFSFSKTQNELFSPSGYNLTLTGLGATKSTLSQINFLQVSADAKAAYMIEPLRLRLYGHVIQGTTAVNDINHLPLSLAMLLGGTDNLKAQSFNSVGPGRITSYGGFEIQKETFKNLYLVGFYDAGAVYNPTPKNTLYDAGGAIMWVSPLGPIKVGLAQGINRHFQRQGGNPRLFINMGPDL